MQAAPPPHENQVRGRDGQWGGENFLDVSLFSFNCFQHFYCQMVTDLVTKCLKNLEQSGSQATSD